jgi:hypothetical protein
LVVPVAPSSPNREEVLDAKREARFRPPMRRATNSGESY